MYGSTELALNCPPAQSPTVTAGLKWPPEMCPTAYAIVSTVRPKAKATPVKPMPSCGKAAASTALPHPPNVNQNVPKNSAPIRRDLSMGFLTFVVLDRGSLLKSVNGPQLKSVRWSPATAVRRIRSRSAARRSEDEI